MRAICVEQFGSVDAVDIREVADPECAQHDVLVHVRAAALNYPDILMIEGKYQDRPSVPFVPGRDAAGEVIAVGSAVTEFAAGDRVGVQARHGAFAEQVAVPEHRCFRLPDELDFAPAAATGTAFATAWTGLILRGELQSRERVLVTGAAGGVGLASVQLAARHGAEVVAAVSSETKAEAVRRAGADHVIRVDGISLRDGLRDALAAADIDGVDVVADVVSGDAADGAVRCLKPHGRLVVLGFVSGRIADIRTNYLLLKNISVVGSPLDPHFESHRSQLQRAMAGIYRDVARGDLDPAIRRHYSLSDLPAACREIMERQVIGKITLAI